MRSAFRLYLVGAKSGDSGCQLNVGNLYDAGTGVRRNQAAALTGTNAHTVAGRRVPRATLEYCGGTRKSLNGHWTGFVKQSA
jgi:hypothetical protein